jgi:hypothetical protein
MAWIGTDMKSAADCGPAQPPVDTTTAAETAMHPITPRMG